MVRAISKFDAFQNSKLIKLNTLNYNHYTKAWLRLMYLMNLEENQGFLVWFLILNISYVTQRDITDPVEANTPDPGQGHGHDQVLNWWHIMPTASKSPIWHRWHVVKTFHSIYRSRMVVSRSNDTDPDGKTKIVSKLRIKLLHRGVVDNLQVKVNDGAEANILPLHSLRSMFPHALDGVSYPWEGFLRGSRTMLECYNDGKLVNHGSITLKLQHYTNNSFQDHQFFVVETPTCREIIVGHPASAKSVTAREAKPNNLTQITNIDGRVPCTWPRSRSEPTSGSCGWKRHKSYSFQDPLSRPLYQNGQRECKMSSFQDPILRDSSKYPTNSIGMYATSSFQDLLSRPLYMDRTPYNEESLKSF